MTTQPHFTEADGTSGERDRYLADPQRPDMAGDPQRPDMAADPLAAPTQPLDDRTPVAADETFETPREEQPRREQVQAAEVPQSSTEEALFASQDLTGLRSRWSDVQAGFVDDPRKCVQAADGLVSDVVQQLTDNFSLARTRLEEQWARGEDVSTEDLRLALKRYRQFFDRLLAV